MSEVVVWCECGASQRMSEFAVGMPALCTKCGKSLTYTRVESTEKPPAQVAKPSSDLHPIYGYRPIDGGGEVARPQARNSPEWRQEPVGPSVVSGGYKPEANSGGPSQAGEFGVCDRCKKSFRGAWDKHETAMGTLCNICANRPIAVDTVGKKGEVQTTPRVVKQREEELQRMSVEDALRAQPKPEMRKAGPPVPRNYLLIAAGCVVFLALFVFFTEPSIDNTSFVGEMTDHTITKKPEVVITPATLWATRGIDFLGWWLGIALPVYIMLATQNKLPFDTFVPNFLHTSMVGLIIAFLSILTGMVPLVGLVLNIAVTIYIIYEFYDCGFTDYIYFILFSILCGIMIYMGKTMLLGAIGLAIT